MHRIFVVYAEIMYVTEESHYGKANCIEGNNVANGALI